MSGSLISLGQQAGAALGLSPLFTDWKSRLRPASFRGVPFFVEGHEEIGGRRGVAHQFPLHDGGITEDLGRALGRYHIDAYVVGGNYDQQRDALRRALYTVAGPGLLVHPWLGSLTVQVLPGCTLRETRDKGGMAIFRLAFVEAATPSLTQNDTAAGVLNAYLPLISALTAAYAVGMLVATHPGFLLQALTAGLTSFAAGLASLPVGTVQSIVATLSGADSNARRPGIPI